MVGTNLNHNPIDPTVLQKRNSLDSNSDKSTQTHDMNDLDIITDRNVAPSPKAMCAELAHEHALEDLYNSTEHSSEQNPVRGPVYSENFLEHATQYEPRRPED
ncbi:uncharacterized protein N7498_010319 [Penicillium cinerascens]|uniref:Uncharacterized protein n=1 Tax=Penicillium cinerascens TaxID=70096 RepID=A0A9W9M791_9EURO|nr:uncharacterized protein N7498_010319 [Penicillium cinerascens]KAJ5191334.1 hypothetical protein N7498_010319 [Penicillium cinerascens]